MIGWQFRQMSYCAQKTPFSSAIFQGDEQIPRDFETRDIVVSTTYKHGWNQALLIVTRWEPIFQSIGFRPRTSDAQGPLSSWIWLGILGKISLSVYVSNGTQARKMFALWDWRTFYRHQGRRGKKKSTKNIKVNLRNIEQFWVPQNTTT